MRQGLTRALWRAGLGAGVLLLLALLVGAGAYHLTGDRGHLTGDRGLARAASWPAAAEAVRDLAIPRPPPLPAPAKPRARPSAEPEALARIVPVTPPSAADVHAVPRALSMTDNRPPDLAAGDRVTVSVSFYYCENSEGTPLGDGGRFCGVMRDGSFVYPGAAACHVAYLGQLFRIEGDAAGLTYRCTDTGSAVSGQKRDIWFQTSAEGWHWQLKIGRTAVIEILP